MTSTHFLFQLFPFNSSYNYGFYQRPHIVMSLVWLRHRPVSWPGKERRACFQLLLIACSQWLSLIRKGAWGKGWGDAGVRVCLGGGGGGGVKQGFATTRLREGDICLQKRQTVGLGHGPVLLSFSLPLCARPPPPTTQISGKRQLDRFTGQRNGRENTFN